MNEFFFVINPGLEELMGAELKTLLDHFQVPFSDWASLHGGISLKSDLLHLRKIIPFLRTPSGLRMRIDQFSAKDFPTFYQKTLRLKWNSYYLGQNVKIKCSSRNSKLFDSRKIEDTIHSALNEYARRNPPKQSFLDKISGSNELIIYCRIEDNKVTLSVDLIGKALYKHGERIHIGEAPLRENLAACLIRSLLNDVQNDCLIDPMCGSGVILMEAHDLYRPLDVSNFSYRFFPVVQRMEELKKNSGAIFENPFSHFEGRDKEAQVLKAAEKNRHDRNIHLDEQDFFDSTIPSGWIIACNPPYNIRISIADAKDFYLQFFSHLKKMNPKLVVLIIPRSVKIPKGLNLIREYLFRNGGIDVKMCLLKPI